MKFPSATRVSRRRLKKPRAMSSAPYPTASIGNLVHQVSARPRAQAQFMDLEPLNWSAYEVPSTPVTLPPALGEDSAFCWPARPAPQHSQLLAAVSSNMTSLQTPFFIPSAGWMAESTEAGKNLVQFPAFSSQ